MTAAIETAGLTKAYGATRAICDLDLRGLAPRSFDASGTAP